MTPTGRDLIQASQMTQQEKWMGAIDNFKTEAKATQQRLGLMQQGLEMGYDPIGHAFTNVACLTGINCNSSLPGWLERTQQIVALHQEYCFQLMAYKVFESDGEANAVVALLKDKCRPKPQPQASSQVPSWLRDLQERVDPLFIPTLPARNPVGTQSIEMMPYRLECFLDKVRKGELLKATDKFNKKSGKKIEDLTRKIEEADKEKSELQRHLNNIESNEIEFLTTRRALDLPQLIQEVQRLPTPPGMEDVRNTFVNAVCNFASQPIQNSLKELSRVCTDNEARLIPYLQQLSSDPAFSGQTVVKKFFARWANVSNNRNTYITKWNASVQSINQLREEINRLTGRPSPLAATLALTPDRLIEALRQAAV